MPVHVMLFYCTVSASELELAVPGFVTVTVTLEAEETSLAATANFRWVASMYVVVLSTPFHETAAPTTYLEPVTVSY